MDPALSKPIDLHQLLLSKKLEPLKPEQISVLQRVQSYDVTQFNESEVRSYIIDPILRVLGYDKGTPFSINLENHLNFLGQRRRSDYHVTLWEENFWLIEAKKPQIDENAFNSEHLEQALLYSIHPDVNAALVVLCDGLKLEVFDREEDVIAPILHVNIQNLLAEFDKVRAILEPMQVWFFQKRRVIRLVDRVFDKEFIMNRVEEFHEIIKDRLRSKSQTITENFRNTVKSDGKHAQEAVETASLSELMELYMMFDYSTLIDRRVTARLVEFSIPRSFPAMHKIFPDSPRPANDTFMGQAGIYLIALSEVRSTVEWVPAWLARGKQSGADLEPIIEFYLDQCLSYFADSEAHRLVLLASSAVRRIAKIFAISNSIFQNYGRDMHALARFMVPELSWEQIRTSPSKQLLGLINRVAETALDDFVSKNTGQDRRFRMESAKLQLRSFWSFEKKLLAEIPNYPALLKERSLGEFQMIECSAVTYDNLAHSLLCRIASRFPKWHNHLLTKRRPQLEKITAMGSAAARNMLGIEFTANVPGLSDEELADRFFLGDIETLHILRNNYSEKLA